MGFHECDGIVEEDSDGVYCVWEQFETDNNGVCCPTSATAVTGNITGVHLWIRFVAATGEYILTASAFGDGDATRSFGAYYSHNFGTTKPTCEDILTQTLSYDGALTQAEIPTLLHDQICDFSASTIQLSPTCTTDEDPCPTRCSDEPSGVMIPIDYDLPSNAILGHPVPCNYTGMEYYLGHKDNGTYLCTPVPFQANPIPGQPPITPCDRYEYHGSNSHGDQIDIEFEFEAPTFGSTAPCHHEKAWSVRWSSRNSTGSLGWAPLGFGGAFNGCADTPLPLSGITRINCHASSDTAFHVQGEACMQQYIRPNHWDTFPDGNCKQCIDGADFQCGSTPVPTDNGGASPGASSISMQAVP